MADDTWTGAGGSNWNTGTSWSTGSAPGSNDNATIPANTGTPHIFLETITVGSLTDAGGLLMDSGGAYATASTLNVNGALTLSGSFQIDTNDAEGGSTLAANSLAVTGTGTLFAGVGDLAAPTKINIGAGGVSDAAGVTGVNNGAGGLIELEGGYDSSNQPTVNSVTMTVATQAGFGTAGHLTGQVELSNAHIAFSSGAIQSVDANSFLQLVGGSSISSGPPDDTNSALIGLSNVAGKLVIEDSSVNTATGTYTPDTLTIGSHLTDSGSIAADNFMITGGGNLEITATGTITYPPGQIASHGRYAPITFVGGSSAAPATLTLDGAAATGYPGKTAALVDFGTGTELDLTGLTYAPGATAVLNGSTLSVASNGITEYFGLQTPTATSFLALPDTTGGTMVVASPACFTTGTRIRTARGDIGVEDLVVGDLVVTACDVLRPILWIGHRDLDGGSTTLPFDRQPVHIAAHAFGDTLPVRDLWLSPGHPVLVGADGDGNGGHLVPIMCLVNGTTVRRMPVATITYWHVELDAHDILLAEGLAAESYLDWGDRPFFTGDSDHTLASPDLVVSGLAGRCRPVAIEGPVVEAERRRLDAIFATRLARAAAWPGDEEFAWPPGAVATQAFCHA